MNNDTCDCGICKCVFIADGLCKFCANGFHNDNLRE